MFHLSASVVKGRPAKTVLVAADDPSDPDWYEVNGSVSVLGFHAPR